MIAWNDASRKKSRMRAPLLLVENTRNHGTYSSFGLSIPNQKSMSFCKPALDGMGDVPANFSDMALSPAYTLSVVEIAKGNGRFFLAGILAAGGKPRVALFFLWKWKNNALVITALHNKMKGAMAERGQERRCRKAEKFENSSGFLLNASFYVGNIK